MSSQYHPKHRPGGISSVARRRRSKLLNRLVLVGILFGIVSSAIKRRILNGADNNGGYAATSSPTLKASSLNKLSMDQSLREPNQRDVRTSDTSGDSLTPPSNRERKLWWHDLSSKCQYILGQTLAPFGESKDVDARSELYAKMYHSTVDTTVLDIFHSSPSILYSIRSCSTPST